MTAAFLEQVVTSAGLYCSPTFFITKLSTLQRNTVMVSGFITNTLYYTYLHKWIYTLDCYFLNVKIMESYPTQRIKSQVNLMDARSARIIS